MPSEGVRRHLLRTKQTAHALKMAFHASLQFLLRITKIEHPTKLAGGTIDHHRFAAMVPVRARRVPTITGAIAEVFRRNTGEEFAV